MKVLRITMYPPRGVGDPQTIVVRDSDVTVSLEEVARQQRDVLPVAFVITDIFSMPDDSIEAATFKASERQQSHEDREQNMALLFYWTGMTIEKKREANMPPQITFGKGAPLSSQEIEYAFEQLAKHPVYSPDVFVETHSNESGDIVTLHNGVVSITHSPAPRFGGRGRYVGPN